MQVNQPFSRFIQYTTREFILKVIFKRNKAGLQQGTGTTDEVVGTGESRTSSCHRYSLPIGKKQPRVALRTCPA